MASAKQINAIVAGLASRGLVTNGKLAAGWGNDVGLPLPVGINQYNERLLPLTFLLNKLMI